MGRMLFIGGAVVAAGGSHGADVLAQDEKIAAVVERGFMATEGLEVRV
ncbi:MAG: hypothetical protein M3151_15460 [Actinomycetota bacterium]|nr:hypothetical protein [Actinomycetota bacterium]